MNIKAFESMTRVGFAARGIMYGLIGYLALRTGRTEDGAGTLDYLAGGSGRLLVAVMALGFFAYGLWRLVEAWLDSSGYGSEPKGLAIRAGGAISGVVHLSLGGAALMLAIRGAGSGGSSTRESAATALGLPGGELILLLVAAGLLIAGVQQVLKAWKLDFLRHLALRAAESRRVRWLGRAGFAARGIVFLMMAWFFGQAALSGSSAEAGGIGEALSSLPATLRTAVAAGLLLFGLFSLVEARFRQIRDPRVLDRLRAAAG